MLRLVLLLLAVIAVATGLAWLADRPGMLVLNWQGFEVETSVFRAVVILGLTIGLSVVAWNLLRQLWLAPAALGGIFNRRRQKRGLEALSSGMIALGAGDKVLATRYAMQARRTLPNEPLTHLLRAQAARLSGDQTTARRIFEAMLSSPDTEQLGLRGLFVEAENEGETEAARQFAERALKLNPKLTWAADALFEIQCKQADWDGALETLAIGRRNGLLEKASADRRRAVLLTAKAQAAEDSDPEKALGYAIEAHGLAVDLVPAAAIAGRILASRGNTPRATRIIQQTWPKAPHPDLAVAYAYARLGDSPRDRLDRVKQLASLAPMSIESSLAVAMAAVESKDWDEARAALEPLVEDRLTQRVCTVMARIEGEQHGDKGRVREWLARAVNAPRDPAWTADGVVSDTWQPVSPVTGALDAFRWRVPVEQAEKRDADLVAQKLEELVALGAPRDPVLSADDRIVEIEADEVVVRDPKVVDVEEVTGRTTGSGTTAGTQAKPEAAAAARGAGGTVGAARASDTSTTAGAQKAPEAGAGAAPAAVVIDRRQTQGASSTAAAKPADASASPGAVAAAESPVSAAARAANAASGAADKAAGSAATAAGSSSGAKAKAGAGGATPRIFVSPPAPDDPGLEAAEADGLARPVKSYSQSK